MVVAAGAEREPGRLRPGDSDRADPTPPIYLLAWNFFKLFGFVFYEKKNKNLPSGGCGEPEQGGTPERRRNAGGTPS